MFLNFQSEIHFIYVNAQAYSYAEALPIDSVLDDVHKLTSLHTYINEGILTTLCIMTETMVPTKYTNLFSLLAPCPCIAT